MQHRDRDREVVEQIGAVRKGICTRVREWLCSFPLRRLTAGEIRLLGVFGAHNGPAASGQQCRVIVRFGRYVSRIVWWAPSLGSGAKVGGPDRDRTGDLVNAIHARSHLRHWPTSV